MNDGSRMDKLSTLCQYNNYNRPFGAHAIPTEVDPDEEVTCERCIKFMEEAVRGDGAYVKLLDNIAYSGESLTPFGLSQNAQEQDGGGVPMLFDRNGYVYMIGDFITIGFGERGTVVEITPESVIYPYKNKRKQIVKGSVSPDKATIEFRENGRKPE